jgi:hypothetical protein
MSFGSHRKMSFVRFILCATVLSVASQWLLTRNSPKAPWSYRGEDNPANWGKTRRRVRHMLCWQKPSLPLISRSRRRLTWPHSSSTTAQFRSTSSTTVIPFK